MATVAEQIQGIYIGLLGRAADQAGLNYWADQINDGALTLEQLRANIVEEQPEYKNGIGQMSRAQAVNALYENLFARPAEDEGLDYWVNGGGSEISFDQLVLALIEGASAADSLTLDNKVEVAQHYTQVAGDDFSATTARDIISDVDGSSQSVTTALKAIDNIGVDSVIPMTVGQDTLEGTSGNDVFEAPIVQNQNGAVTNTLESGDVIDGGEGTDTLNADLTLTTSGSIPVGPAIAPTTDNVEIVNFTAQSINLDTGGSGISNVDAGKMTGVEQWWSDNSRADVIIEDVRSTPMEAAFGMRDTDPGMNFQSFINANHLDAGVDEGESAFNFTIRDPNNLGSELQNITVIGIRFKLDGESYELGGADVEAAKTWGELQTALQAQIDDTEGLEGLIVEDSGNGQFVVTDPNGGDFVIAPAGTVITSSTTTEEKAAAPGVPVVEELPTETDIVLDGAGNGSEGGAMNVGVMSGERGVEIFHVDVQHDSHLAPNGSSISNAALASTNLRTGNEYLEEVYVEGEGKLSLGTKLPLGATTDDRLLTNGLVNVRVFDASGFEQELKVGATLNDNAISRYLDDASEPVQFTYNLGDGGSNLSLNLSNGLTTDTDFKLDINGGAEDDRVNLSGNYALQNVSIDGGKGYNTLETSSDIGTNGASTPAAFDNIQKLVLAGGTNVNANMTPLAGVEDLVVATSGGANSTIRNLEADTNVSLSGKNQTLGNNSDANQAIGTINLVNAQATKQHVDLDNTARSSGVLTVADILVAGANNKVNELVLSSNGVRNTSNVVGDIQAANATKVTFEGTQSLSANISDLASSPNKALTADGSALEGNLSLGVVADLLVKDSTDKLVGTDGDSDKLSFDGTFAVDGSGNAKASTNVSEFENVQFGAAGGAQGTYDASNTTGVELYDFANLSGDISINGLRGTENVRISHTGNEDIALTAGAKAAGNTLNAEVVNPAYVGDLIVDDYRTINLDLNNATGAQQSFTPGLVLNGFGDASDTMTDVNAGDAGSNYAREVNFSGGRDEQNEYNNSGVLVTSNADKLTQNGLSNSLNSIDVSGFEGEFSGGFVQATDNTGATFTNANVLKELNTNTDITVGEYEFNWDNSLSRDTANSDFAVTTFNFTEDAYTDGVVWQIDDFLQSSGNAQNLDKINLSAFDNIQSEANLKIEYGDWDGTNFSLTNSNGGYADSTAPANEITDSVRVTHNGDMDFEILLTGLDTNISNGLVGDNFMF